MRIWRAHNNDDREEFFRNVNKAIQYVQSVVGTHTEGYTFEGVYQPPEPWELEYHGDGIYEYADWRIEPVSVK